jgi:restriction system protein
MFLPDGRVSGLFDAMTLIRAWYFGKAGDVKGRLLTLMGIHHRQFERLVADLYERMGYEVVLTKQSRDGGRDIIATRSEPGHRERLDIECKQYTSAVGSDAVNRLAGAMEEYGANKGVLVTTSHFSRPALKRAEGVPRIELIRGDELVPLLNRYFGARWPERIDGILMSDTIKQNSASNL